MLDSGLIIVVFIISVLLWVVGMLLFYGHMDASCASVTNISMVGGGSTFREKLFGE